MEKIFDLAIIGGGINGCGIAAEAATRGASTVLIEKDDLASKTSSSSSKLIHGGLRYLENYDFNLVKKALNERQILLTVAPHLVHALPFFLPYDPNMRPTWLLRAGLFLYDRLSRQNQLPKSQYIKHPLSSSFLSPLQDTFQKGFLFYDCATDDARLTLVNALQAKQYGAIICPRTTLISSEIINNHWQLHIKLQSGESSLLRAKCIINATGPWVREINQLLNISNHYNMSLVKGSHLLVSKLYEGEQAYLLQHTDKRILFVLPYHGHTMIGTTDIALHESLDNIHISTAEIIYLCSVVNRYFKRQVDTKDILASWSGVRPLIDDPKVKKTQLLSRDYHYHLSFKPALALSIYGGKITTYRQLAFEVINTLASHLPHLKPSTSAHTPLPGAIFNHLNYQNYVDDLQTRFLWLPQTLKRRLLKTYGTKLEKILSPCQQMQDLGHHFGHELYQVEVDYLVKEEWACTNEDILWRRTKLGFKFTPEEQQQLMNYLSNSNNGF